MKGIITPYQLIHPCTYVFMYALNLCSIDLSNHPSSVFLWLLLRAFVSMLVSSLCCFSELVMLQCTEVNAAMHWKRYSGQWVQFMCDCQLAKLLMVCHAGRTPTGLIRATAGGHHQPIVPRGTAPQSGLNVTSTYPSLWQSAEYSNPSLAWCAISGAVAVVESFRNDLCGTQLGA